MSELATSLDLENDGVRLLEAHFRQPHAGEAPDGASAALWKRALLNPLSDFLSRPGK